MLLILSLQYVSCNFYYEGLDGEDWVLFKRRIRQFIFFLNPKRGFQLDLWFISDHYDSKTNELKTFCPITVYHVFC